MQGILTKVRIIILKLPRQKSRQQHYKKRDQLLRVGRGNWWRSADESSCGVRVHGRGSGLFGEEGLN